MGLATGGAFFVAMRCPIYIRKENNMPIERLVLIIFCVVTAAAATIWVGSLLFVSTSVSPALGIAVLSVFALVGYVVWRVISERLNNPDEDHYDNMEN
jgi:membrane protein implicated in regulation of membrane protease activity